MGAIPVGKITVAEYFAMDDCAEGRLEYYDGEVFPLVEATYTNPKVIVEILSPTTNGFDHGGKFALYRELPSFTEYVLIAQDKPKVEVFHKESASQWRLSLYDGLDALIKLRRR